MNVNTDSGVMIVTRVSSDYLGMIKYISNLPTNITEIKNELKSILKEITGRPHQISNTTIQ